MIEKTHDVTILGGGLAGIVSAIDLAKQNLDVAIIFNRSVKNTASFYAQGGIAAVVSEKDSIQSHHDDTMLASSGSSNSRNVRSIVAASKNAITWLENHGVIFDKLESGKYSLHLEGGHSLNRILHVKDYTGKAIISELYKQLPSLENITVYEETTAFKLLTNDNKCVGLMAYTSTDSIIKMLSNNTILASGGASGIYKYVTNSNAGFGDTMVMAHEIGCALKNLEFTQFHPTCYFDENKIPTLISEAIRGNGAILETKSGTKIMEHIHIQKDLAPRDVVARQIYQSMQKSEDIYLNATNLSKTEWQEKFPYIYSKLINNNIDPSVDRIPIFPAAHYSCGGIEVDRSARTSVKGIYAVGEAAYTGLHGSNRLASNSLLECVVTALVACKSISKHINDTVTCDVDNMTMVAANHDYSDYISQIRQIMWNGVGLVRSQSHLAASLEKLAEIDQHTYNKYSSNVFCKEYYKMRSLLTMSQLTIQIAINRKKSLGSHFLVSNQ